MPAWEAFVAELATFLHSQRKRSCFMKAGTRLCAHLYSIRGYSLPIPPSVDKLWTLQVFGQSAASDGGILQLRLHSFSPWQGQGRRVLLYLQPSRSRIRRRRRPQPIIPRKSRGESRPPSWFMVKSKTITSRMQDPLPVSMTYPYRRLLSLSAASPAQ